MGGLEAGGTVEYGLTGVWSRPIIGRTSPAPAIGGDHVIRHFTASLAACMLAVSLTAPQDPPGQRAPFRTDINLVLVDVHVTRGGRPVTDLTAADFRVRENGAVQQIASIEYVEVDAPQSAVSMEPSSVAASLDLAADPRNRVFILFMDAFHVTEVESLQTGTALVNALDRLIAPNDLVGVMTPHMAASQVTLGRKAEVFRRGLLDNRRWGRKVETCRSVNVLDEVELGYLVCYLPPPPPPPCDISPTAMELIRLRRESFTLGALRDAVRYIGAAREARTVFVLVTEGWALRKADAGLTNVASKPPQIKVGPGGRLGTLEPGSNVDRGLCDKHLHTVAQLDTHRDFLDLIDEANRNNASFFVMDPGGLRVEGGYVDTLRTLADNTNGETIVDTNDLRGGLERAMSSLSGYYLLGYYSTNSRHDGRYRTIAVDVAQPGVEVRARKGYRAWTAEEIRGMTDARAASAVPPDPAVVERAEALGRLARLSPDRELYLHGSIAPAGSTLYLSGELASAVARAAEWRGGAEAEILVTGSGDTSVGSGRATMAPGVRAFHVHVPLDQSLADGEYEVAVRLRTDGGATGLAEKVRIGVSRGPIGEPLAFRAANRAQPVATFLWLRSERVFLEAPVAAGASNPAARLLDRAGQPIPVPVDASIRDGADGRWLVADLRLAPLAPADYLIELSAASGGVTVQRVVPVRVGR
jgi:VWFA-related protein